MTEYIERRIKGYWKNAKLDYDINGYFIECRRDGNRLVVRWHEEGFNYTMPINIFEGMTKEDAFNIWMEQDWSIYAD